MTCVKMVLVKAVVQIVHDGACFKQRAFVLLVVSATWVCGLADSITLMILALECGASVT